MTFGDYEPGDAFDTAELDPAQLAERIHRYRRSRGLEPRTWRELPLSQRVALVAIATDVVAWMRRGGLR